MMDSSPSRVNMQPTLPRPGSLKRQASALLPAFEPSPSSSSPGFPRPAKRRATSQDVLFNKYPTPVPSSDTILASSPPKIHVRPSLKRAQSTFSERAPLVAVAKYTLPEDGRTVTMGRSSNSSDYQLSANRLISRVHVKAQYIAASTPLHVSKVVITCSGWNGVKVHCYGRTWDLGKGDSFTSETESAEIMLDVQDARVIVGWPEVEKSSASSSEEPESSWEDDGSPSRRVKALSARGKEIHSSPERPGHRLASPESPSLAKTLSVQKGKFSDLFADFDGETSLEIPEVKVFEDAFADATPENNDGDEEEATQLPASFEDSFSSSLSEPSDSSDDHNPDEENDPLIYSFGPFGANILPNLESFTTAATPEQPRRSSTSKSSQVSPAKDVKPDTVPMVNHVVNQLAFSRLSSTPLASVMHQLPSKYLSINPISNLPDFTITKAELHVLLLKVACVGEIRREGKDAAGQPLESEFYYIPDMDDDEERKAAVVDGLRKPSLRNCRKQHKQYYWKKPRTP